MKKLHIAVVLSAVLIIGGILSWLIWTLGGGRETFGPLSSYFFICLSIVIATIAALNAAIASVVASKSLELTRATTRPFLTITGGKYEGVMQRMQLRIENTGLLPADDMSLEIETIEPKNIVSSLVKLIDISTSIFPNEYKTEIIAVNAKLSAEINSGAELKVLVKITYYFEGEPHHTNRMLHLPPSKSGRQAEEQLDFLSEGNYWD